MPIIRKLFWPDARFAVFSDITPDFLRSEKIKALICDIDNTLVTYDDPLPTPEVRNWITDMHNAGIGIAFVSNNSVERVETFNSVLGLPAYGDAGKPARKYLDIAISEMRCQADECAVLGDQLFTDVFSGKRAGMKAYLVPPIKDKRTALFRFKRALEKPILKSYEKHKNREV